MTISLINITLKINRTLIFYVSLCCTITFILLVFYNMNNGDYFGIDKYSFYMILSSVCESLF